MIKFIKRFRDGKKLDKFGNGKLYMPAQTAKFDAVREAQLVKSGFAVKVEKKGAKEDKNAAPKNIEKK